ncbi:hypothetical protein ACTOB_003791 [Actinoplanes oblitus]|uniref:Uncharacterized protein n=1 Tax=Actinoplanes oblitus TaxID=3040509 RepID=A0ABY8WTH1_9ACTN|nr:hypothetical protein [Actinoplanes oblitus]WIN00108.1 hypothetical protein ACTOB_003791 [Actinoplanes oblitus]
MAEPVEHVVQSPCGWCGEQIQQPPRGRKLRYCDRNCRQRAYEMRTAQARRQADVDAGRIAEQPAERIVERVVRSRVPRTPAGWEAVLAQLQTQLGDGTIGFWNAGRIQQALIGALNQADRLAGQARVTVRPPVDERLEQAAAVLLRLAGNEPVTLQRLAAAMQLGIDEVRQAVLELEHLGLLVARRAANVVSVDELAVHSRFILSPH